MLVALKKAHLMHPALQKPIAYTKTATPAYSATLLLDRDHPQLGELQLAIETVANDRWEHRTEWVFDQLRCNERALLRDGNQKPARAPYTEFVGKRFFTAKSQCAPCVTDWDESLLTRRAKRQGVWLVDAEIEVWAQDNSFGKRINA